MQAQENADETCARLGELLSQLVAPPGAPCAVDGESDPDIIELTLHLWDGWLTSMSGVFQRLVFLTNLCDMRTGQYSYYGLEVLLGPTLARKTLASRHVALFYDWLALPLAAQLADFEQYLADAGGHRKEVLKSICSSESWGYIVPQSIEKHERDLFASEFMTVLRTTAAKAGLGAGAVRDKKWTIFVPVRQS